MFRGVKFLFSYTWRFEKRYVIYNLLNQFLTGIVLLGNIIIPKFIIEELMGQQKKVTLILWISLLLGVNLFGKMLSSFLGGQCFALKGSVFTQFQAFLTGKLANCDFECLEDPEFLDTKEKARKFLYANGQGFGVVLDSAFNIIGKVFSFAGIMVVLSTLNVFIVLLFVGLILLHTKYEAKVRSKYVSWDMEKAPIERRTSYLSNLVEDISYGKEIRLYGIKDWLVSKVIYHLNESNEFYKKQINELIKAQYSSSFMNFIMEGVTYASLAFRVVKHGMSIGSFTMYVSAMLNFSHSMQDVMRSFLDMNQFGGYYEALEKYLNVPAKMRDGKNEKLPSGDYEIEFCNVSFKYPKQEKWALQNINLKIRGGEKLSVVGENGAGKTTFIKLLCRMYDPTEGKITLAGVDIRDIEYGQYMSIIGSVFQDFKLFSFSLKDNICFDRSLDTPDEVIIKILKESGFGEKLDRLDKGIHTSINKNFDESGFEPSGGEGQKIAIARAVYKDTPIIVLDEPTSALDPRAEYELYQRFNRMVENKTAIFISHRLSSSKFCDSIALFENGNIIEYGSHEELMKRKGRYEEIFAMQAQYYV